MEITTPWRLHHCTSPGVANVLNRHGQIVAMALPVAEAKMIVASKTLLDACLFFQHAREDCRDKGIGPDEKKLNETLDAAIKAAL